jgi:hypothetical protein
MNLSHVVCNKLNPVLECSDFVRREPELLRQTQNPLLIGILGAHYTCFRVAKKISQGPI